MDRKLLSVSSAISQDTSKSLRHINSLRHKSVNQLGQFHLSLCANSPKCNKSSLCYQIAASYVVVIAMTGTRAQHSKLNVGHMGRWTTSPVFVGKKTTTCRSCTRRLTACQQLDQRSYELVFLTPIKVKTKSIVLLCHCL